MRKSLKVFSMSILFLKSLSLLKDVGKIAKRVFASTKYLFKIKIISE